MSLENRIEKLEQFQKSTEEMTLQGVLFFHPKCILVDGVEYSSIEDVPPSLRLKYGAITVGHVSDEKGRTANVVAGVEATNNFN